MTLIERYRANRCAVVGCDRERAPDSAVCKDDLRALWRHELIRQADGTYTRRRMFAAREDASWRAAA